MCIVLMAIMLDRTTTAASMRAEIARAAGKPPRCAGSCSVSARSPAVVAIYVSRHYLGRGVPRDEFGHKVGGRSRHRRRLVHDTSGGVTQAFKDAVTYGFLNPLQSLLAESPL